MTDFERRRIRYEAEQRERDRAHEEKQRRLHEEFIRASILKERSDQITLLEAYSKFLEERGYLDTDWRTEAPYAIDEFLKTQKP